MSLFLQLIKINDYIAATIAILGNLLLMFLIFTTKKKELKSLSRLLIQSCLLDTALGIITVLCQPQTIVKNNIFYVVIGGYISNKDPVYASIMLSSYMAFVVLNLCAMPIPFYLRYLVICRKMTLNVVFSQKLFPAYIPVTFVVLAVFACGLWCYPPIPDCLNNYSTTFDTDFWREQYREIPLFACTVITAWSMTTIYTIITVSVTIAYTFVVFYCIKIYRELHSMTEVMSQKTKEMNTQVNQTLIFQASGPLIVGTGPLLIIIIMILFTIENIYISISCVAVIAWVPTVNPIAAILIIKPYRQRILAIFKNNKINPSAVNAIEAGYKDSGFTNIGKNLWPFNRIKITIPTV